MSEIDPLVAQILLKGDDEFIEKLKRAGEQAESSFAKMEAAGKAGASGFSLASMGIGMVETAIASAVAASILFVEQQTALSQATQLLAESFGSSAGQLQELEAIFASSGVKVEQFERFATRLTTTIARQWPQIAESIKMYATENDAATLRVREAILKIRDAQNAVFDNASARSSQMQHDYLSLEKASASLASAQHHLAELTGGIPLSDSAKKQLEIDSARLAVKAAIQARDDAARKSAKDARDDAEQSVKDQNAVKNAIIARDEAEDKADKLALTSIASIRDALHGVETGNKGMATAIDLSRVSVDNLVKGMIALAAETSKGIKPTGWEALSTISKTLAADQDRVKQGLDPLIDKEQRLAVVTRLAGTSMQALGKSASEILDVLENSSLKIEDLKNHADRLAKIDPKGVRDFRAALYSLNFEIGLLSQRFASWAAPAFTAFLIATKEKLQELVVWLEKADDVAAKIHSAWSGKGWVNPERDPNDPTKVNPDIAKKAEEKKAADQRKAQRDDPTNSKMTEDYYAQRPAAKGLDAVEQSSSRAAKALDALAKSGSGKGGGGGGYNDSSQGGGGYNSHAEGGDIRGPGSGTSDSILARLSNGEFVMKAKSVAAYGSTFMHAINNMTFPGFAMGGLVPAPVRMAGGGSVPATSVVNLSIDGRSFGGLRGAKSTVDDLSAFAISRQTSAAGSNPGWYK